MEREHMDEEMILSVLINSQYDSACGKHPSPPFGLDLHNLDLHNLDLHNLDLWRCITTHMPTPLFLLLSSTHRSYLSLPLSLLGSKYL